MKAVFATLGVVLLGGVGSVVFLWPARHTGPEPIAYGRDTCAHCRMHLSRPGFGGEIRDRDGVLTKYDDIGCMLRAMIALHREIPETWVEDHGGSGLIPLLTAHLVRTDGNETPMGSGILAFADAAAADEFAHAQAAELVNLEDLVKDPARWAQGPKTGSPAEDRGHP